MLLFTQYEATCLRGPCPRFLEWVVILRFERRYPKENNVARLKSNILTPQNFLARKKSLAWPRHWVIVLLHRLSKMCEVNTHVRKSALTIVTWSEPLKIRCHVIVTQQRATTEQCALKFRNVWVCRPMSGHEWNASSSLHHIRYSTVWVPYR